MASIYRQKNSKYWYITWMEKVDGVWAHRQRSTRLTSKSRALDALRLFENAREGRLTRDSLESLYESVGVERKPSLPLSELWDWYVSNCEVTGNDKQRRSRRGFLEAFLSWLDSAHPEIRQVDEVSQRLASEYWGHLSKEKKSASTRNNALSALSVVWKSVQAPLELERNPWASIRRDQGGSIRYEPFTIEEIRSLMGNAEKIKTSADPGFWTAAIEMGFYTGLRLGDIATLEYEEINLQEKFLILMPNKTKKWGTDHVSVHSLSLPWVRLLPSLTGAGPVFPKAAEAYRKTHLSREFTSIARLAGIRVSRDIEEGERRVKDVKLKCFHSLRHSYATYLLMSGITEDELRQQGNWTDMRVISDHYNHAKLDLAKKTAEKVASIYSSGDILKQV